MDLVDVRARTYDFTTYATALVPIPSPTDPRYVKPCFAIEGRKNGHKCLLLFFSKKYIISTYSFSLYRYIRVCGQITVCHAES